MKQLILLFLVVAAFIVGVGLFSKTSLPQNRPSLVKTLPSKEIIVSTLPIKVEVADDEEERRKGLGGRTSLGENEGMLFVFPATTSNLVFWMKDMKFPLDIIWINTNKIVKIDKDVKPEPGISDNDLKRYYPENPANFVLEVNGGFADKKGIKVGDSVEIPQAP